MSTKSRMYGVKNDDIIKGKEKRTKVYVSTLAQSYHTIKQDDNVDIQVPSLAYTKGLEQSLKVLINRIEKLENQVKSLTGNNLRQKQHIIRQHRQIGALENDIDNKIDRRDY